MNEKIIKVKELIHEEVCMGTYGLVELELIEFEKQATKDKMILDALKNRLNRWIEDVEKLESAIRDMKEDSLLPEADKLAGQALGLWTVKQFLEVNCPEIENSKS
jgi:hypothetical protein